MSNESVPGGSTPAAEGAGKPSEKSTEAKPPASEAKPAASSEAKPAASSEAKPAASSEGKPAASSEAKPVASSEVKPTNGHGADAPAGKGLGKPVKKKEAPKADEAKSALASVAKADTSDHGETIRPPARGTSRVEAREADAKAERDEANTSGTHDASTIRKANGQTHGHGQGNVWKLALAALGVVYGDIGTSPLYALRECFHESPMITPVSGDVLGLLSLFFWAMTLVVSVKYVAVITRADNHGEGGILALLALVIPKRGTPGKIPALVAAGLFGAALLYADGMLTPAISVLSAVEGMEGIAQGLDRRVVVGVSVAILFTLFVAQRRGTGGVGMIFGPIMLVWFLTIGSLGAYWIVQNPGVLWAIDPRHAASFFLTHHMTGFWVLGSVVLCITGGEALYADMGHFGRKPITWSWTVFVWPCLTLNYLGQGALLLSHPDQVEDSFFAMVGDGAPRVAMVLLATAATVIASQALISGAFSLTRQAIQLGYLPRLEIRHTSGEHEGQIYVPEINWLLMTACITLVVGFQSSSRMAAAYGIAVTGTMAITTVLFFMVSRKWWGDARAAAACFAMLVIDLSFFSANLIKVESGGWIPLVVAFGILFMMTTWKLGRDRVAKFLRNRSEPLEEFLDQVHDKHPARVKGTAVFMTSTSSGTPPVLLHHYRHNQVLHEQVVLLSIVGEDVPVVPRDHRVEVTKLREGFFRVTAHYGFMQSPKVIDILRVCTKHGLMTSKNDTSFYLGREKLVITRNPGLSWARKVVFSFLSRNARPATDFFDLPPERVVEMGMQLEL
jgi:KUP system potassium uptake protein